MTFTTEAQAREFLARFGIIGAGAGIAIAATTHAHWTFTGTRAAQQPLKICSICGESFPEYGCNAQPINDGRCCSYCDDHVVTPARIREAELI